MRASTRTGDEQVIQYIPDSFFFDPSIPEYDQEWIEVSSYVVDEDGYVTAYEPKDADDC